MTVGLPTPRVRRRSRLWERRWTWAHRLSQALFLGLLVAGRHLEPRGLTGSTASTLLLGTVHLTDPLSALEVTLASRQLLPALWIGAGLLLAVYALSGRLFCGWVCPLGLVLDLTDDLGGRFMRRGPDRRPDRRLQRRTKYVLLGLFLALSASVSLPVFTLISPIHALSRSLVFGLEAGLVLVAGIVAFELFYSRRAWCRDLCPLGAFYSLLGRRAVVHVRIRNAGRSCTECRLCTRDCPMGLPVLETEVLAGHAVVGDPECSRCGTCLDDCPGGVLHLGVALARKP